MAILVPRAALAQDDEPVILSAFDASLTLADMPQRFRDLGESDVSCAATGVCQYRAIFFNGSAVTGGIGPIVIGSYIYAMEDGSRVPDSEFANISSCSVLDRGYRDVPREFPGEAIGEETHWCRVTDDSRPPENTFSVAFRSGNGAARLVMDDLVGGVDGAYLQSFADLVRERLASQ